MVNHLHIILNQLGLIKNQAVFFRKEKNGKDFSGFTSEIKKKIDILKPDAYYVFNNQPFILFFDLSLGIDLKREKDIHKQVWSFDHAPVMFIIKNADVQIFNAFKYSKQTELLDEIKLSQDERNDVFSFWNLQSGFTWNTWSQEHLISNHKSKNKKRANQQLFENIQKVREGLTDDTQVNPLNEEEANILILRLIFIRYLIDRGVKIDVQYINGNSPNEQRNSFSALIENPKKLNDLFNLLNEKFNGVLFKKSALSLDVQQSKLLAKVFKGEKPEEGTLFYGTDYYFEIFDFSIIPVEVISGIYESLINEETRKLDAAVYTPSFLVEYILKDTIEPHLKGHLTSECKIFDPSVGSGIFLVQSLRKMIDYEIYLNGNVDKEKFSDRIRTIAKNNLFGIDVNPHALKVTCFSIYIALLDYQEPKDIAAYKFPNLLDENLFEANFFNATHAFNKIIKDKKVQFILGNPPWKKDNSKVHLNWINSTNTYSKKVNGKLEIAQSFLMRSKDFMTDTTVSALVVTSTLFYNISLTNKEFKKDFLSTFCVDRFFDLSPVRRLVFEQKNSPASIVYYHLSKGNEYLKNIIKHQSIKWSRFLKNYQMLVIEKYDQKEILQKHFIDNDWMFKVALYGNTLDFHFLQRISLNKKVSDFITENKGFTGLGVIKISERSKTKPKHYPELVGLPVVENGEVNLFYTEQNKRLLTSNDVNFIRGRELDLFLHGKILLKEQCFDETNLSVSFQENSGVFVNGVSGISFANENTTKMIYSFLISNVISYYLYLTSCAWGIGTRPAIRFQDEYLAFPFIEPNKSLSKELVVKVNQFLKPFQEYYDQVLRSESLPINQAVLNEINGVINKLYEVSEYEIDLIDYVLNVSRYQFQENKQIKFTRSVSQDRSFLESYASVYLAEFSKIYSDEYLIIEVYALEYFIAMNFVFSPENPKKSAQIIFPDDNLEVAAILKKLANNLSISQITNTEDSSKNLFIQKDIKGFEENSFYIIKPNEYKCWHRAMAWYDVAEFKEAIESAEITHLENDFDGF